MPRSRATGDLASGGTERPEKVLRAVSVISEADHAGAAGQPDSIRAFATSRWGSARGVNCRAAPKTLPPEPESLLEAGDPRGGVRRALGRAQRTVPVVGEG